MLSTVFQREHCQNMTWCRGITSRIGALGKPWFYHITEYAFPVPNLCRSSLAILFSRWRLIMSYTIPAPVISMTSWGPIHPNFSMVLGFCYFSQVYTRPPYSPFTPVEWHIGTWTSSETTPLFLKGNKSFESEMFIMKELLKNPGPIYSRLTTFNRFLEK